MPPADSFSQQEEEVSVEEQEAAIEQNQLTIKEVNETIDKIDLALPTVNDLTASDSEMDELADMASSSFKDLMDLAMNVEARFSGPILQSASTLLGHAISAKVAKMDKKLKMVDLQLKKARLDAAVAKAAETKPTSGEEPIKGEGVVMCRNDLIKMIASQVNQKDK